MDNFFSTAKKAKKKVFISFDFDNDQFLRTAIVSHSKLEDCPYEIEDWSVKEPWDDDEWKDKCLTKIKKCDLVIVMVGEKTHACSGVKAEIQMAKEAKVRVVGIQGYKDKNCPRPDGLEGYYIWTWDNIDKLVGGK
jgi:hypothetical protein